MVPEYADKIPEDDREVLFSVRPGISDPPSIYFLTEDGVLASNPDVETIYISTFFQ